MHPVEDELRQVKIMHFKLHFEAFSPLSPRSPERIDIRHKSLNPDKLGKLPLLVRRVGVSVRNGGAGASAHLLLADEAAVHAAGGVVPAPDRHALHHTCFHDVATVLVDVVVGLADLPKATVGRQEAR